MDAIRNCWRCGKDADASRVGWALKLGSTGLCRACCCEWEPRRHRATRKPVLDGYSSCAIEHLQIACDPHERYTAFHAARGRGWTSSVRKLVRLGLATMHLSLSGEYLTTYVHATVAGREELERLVMLAEAKAPQGK